jgi:hypothetical protein
MRNVKPATMACRNESVASFVAGLFFLAGAIELPSAGILARRTVLEPSSKIVFPIGRSAVYEINSRRCLNGPTASVA